MAAALAVLPTLYDAEEGLLALLDTAELVTSADEAAFLADFQAALTTAVDKRDRVAHRLAKLEAQQAFAAAEIKRLQEFKKSCEAQQERLEGYVSYVIQRLGKDAKGKWRKLEGNSTSMFLRACAPSVDVTDESQVPNDYRRVSLTIPASTFEDWLNAIDDDTFREKVLADIGSSFDMAADKRAIKAAIEAGVEIAGAKLITDKPILGRK